LIFKDPFGLQAFFYFLFGLEEFHEEIALGALGHILAVEPSCLADNIHKCYDFSFLHKILLAGCMDE
jgi:hypothetical protein